MIFPLRAALVLLAPLGVAAAQSTVLVPDVVDHGTAGDSQFGRPFAVNAPSRVQYLYDASNFTSQGIGAGMRINGLRWRAQEAATVSLGLFPTVTIRMSYAATDHAAASTTFDSNFGPAKTVVYQGGVTTAFRPSATPGMFFVSVALSRPFHYDPTTGRDLLIEVVADQPTLGLVGAATDADSQGGRGTVISQSGGSLTVGTKSSIAPVLELQYDEALVLPSISQGTALPANSFHTLPWRNLSWGTRVQFAYGASNFGSVAGDRIQIDRLRWLADGQAGAATSYSNVRIALSTAALPQQSLSQNFTDNIGLDRRVVFEGSVNVAAVQAGQPRWYIDIEFDTPFIYDPSAGDLLIDVGVDGAGWSGGVPGYGARFSQAQSSSSMLFGNYDYDGASGTVINDWAPVLEIGYGWSPKAVTLPIEVADGSEGNYSWAYPWSSPNPSGVAGAVRLRQ